ncbi:gamete egress and sporozoite traversal protein [Plasmodium gonderi]|uniref:Gamete egress and sporozoite traversal protein n=1 Tax=Plasmodium gonderi TaxID=77519 RepID=A0A1Y1JMZ0_PLAGO|nr:gamete egress and sporozoite traversal protein [Plasmodium gonderi]GAW82597.1 gamete egress and sporozoite traversal protein [Plasmodium gonderi]
MKSFVYYTGLLISLALQLRAIQLNSNNMHPISYVELGDRISNKVGALWKSQLDSFVDVVSTRIVDKLENDISNSDGAENMLILLENNAEIFDTATYNGHNMALIEDEFINKLKEKFHGSNFGKGVKKLGSKLKGKLTDLYKKHKDKLKHFLKVMITGLVIPMAIKFIRKHLTLWRKKTLDVTKKLDEDARNVATPVINALYDQFEQKLQEYAEENQLNSDKEMNIMDQLQSEKKSIENIEKQEKKILQQ